MDKKNNDILNDDWILYFYDKQMYKKIINLKNVKISTTPYKKLFEFKTISEFWNLNKYLNMTVDYVNETKILEKNNYIFMKNNIQPVWEDEKNSNGGSFNIKVPHSEVFSVWETIMLYLIGCYICKDCDIINGMSITSYHDNDNMYYSNMKIKI